MQVFGSSEKFIITMFKKVALLLLIVTALFGLYKLKASQVQDAFSKVSGSVYIEPNYDTPELKELGK